MFYGLLYGLWGLLFAVSAWVGFLPAPQTELVRTLSMALAISVFVPPAIILFKSQSGEGEKHRKVVRNLCLASIGGTVLVMALNVMSAGWSEQMGNALYAALVVVSAPMICGRNYMLSLSLWGGLLMGSLNSSNNKR